MKIKSLIGSGLVAGALLLGSPAGAAVSFDPATGTGFVGKGDVQLALSLNNAQIQGTSLAFAYNSTSVTETTWTCSKVNPQGVELTQERARTTTTETQGVVSAVNRVKNQITGYNLSGFSGSPVVSVESDGPSIGSCPNGWTADTPETTDPVVTAGGLSVNGVALQ